MKTVLLTGASGFLGQFLATELVRNAYKVIGISRQAMQAEAGAPITWLQADLSESDSLQDFDLLDSLAAVDIIIHAAALYDFAAQPEAYHKHNVIAMGNLLHLAQSLPRQPYFCLISSIAVAGKREGFFSEDISLGCQALPDAYAASKFAAEQMLRRAGLPRASVIRLGILLGSSRDGYIPKIDGPYYFQKMIRELRSARRVLEGVGMLPLPFGEHSVQHVLPVDHAAEVITQLLPPAMKYAGLRVYHLVGAERGISIRKILSVMLKFYGIQLVPLALAPRLLPAALMRRLGIPPEVRSYLENNICFDTSHLREDLPDYQAPAFESYAETILSYAENKLFRQGH